MDPYVKFRIVMGIFGSILAFVLGGVILAEAVIARNAKYACYGAGAMALSVLGMIICAVMIKNRRNK